MDNTSGELGFTSWN